MENVKYVNIQNGKQLDREIELKSNSLLNVRPDLFIEWDFDRNNQLKLDIYKVSKGTEKLAWWICKDCHSNFDMPIERRKRGQGCPYCRGLKVNDTNSLHSQRPDLLKLWSFDKNINISPKEVTCGIATKVWWHCDVCDDHYPMAINKKASGRGCSICSGYYTTNKNSLGGLYPEIAQHWHPTKNNQLTPYDVSKRSGIKVWWKCIDCNSDYQMTIDKRVSTNQQSNYCPVCASGLSFGEKIMYEILLNCDVKFEKEKSFDWSNGKKYDFYLPEYNCIIEVHGEQHYNGSFSRMGGRTLLEEIENDELKETLAEQNGIINYIVIKSIKYDLKLIKKEIIKSGLLNVLGIDKSIVDNIRTVSMKSVVVKSWELYNDGFDKKAIIEKLSIHRKTVERYLRLGKELGIIN